MTRLKKLSPTQHQALMNAMWENSQALLVWGADGNCELVPVENQYQSARDKPIVDANIKKAEENLK